MAGGRPSFRAQYYASFIDLSFRNSVRQRTDHAKPTIYPELRRSKGVASARSYTARHTEGKQARFRICEKEYLLVNNIVYIVGAVVIVVVILSFLGIG